MEHTLFTVCWQAVLLLAGCIAGIRWLFAQWG